MRRAILWGAAPRAFTVVGFAVILAVMLWVAATAPPATMSSSSAAFAQYPPSGGPDEPGGGGGQGQPAKKPKIHYFALGDSIASGYGLEGATGDCDRTLKKSYPGVVSSLLAKRYDKVNTTQLACSGATAGKPKFKGLWAKYKCKIPSLERCPHKWFRNQVDDMIRLSKPIPADEPILVSITIGANDFGFPDEVLQNLCTQPNKEEFDKWAAKKSAQITRRVRYQVDRILKERPNARVVLTEFYNPVNLKPNRFGGLVGRPCREAHVWMEDAITRMNHHYALAVAALNQGLNPPRVHIAPIKEAFEGHEAPVGVCGQEPPTDVSWIQPRQQGLPFPDCFHPNVEGAINIGKAVDAAAKEAGLKRNGFILLSA
jgi:lysophospholipase L1-like esterase